MVIFNWSKLLLLGVLSVLRISYGSSVICDQLDSPVQDEKVTENLRMLGDRVSELLTLQSYLHFKESLNQEVCGHQ